jgi:hypothetical protein
VTRSHGTEDLVKLAQAYERIMRRESLASDDLLLIQWVLEAIMKNDDPRPRFHTPLEGATSSSHRPFLCMDFLLQPDATTRPNDAAGRVADSWGLESRTVLGIVTELGSDMKAIVHHAKRDALSREALARVVGWHRIRYLADNSPPNSKT